MRWIGVVAAGICALLVCAAAAAQPRIALVIGNGAYATSPLPNPVNDARAVAQALRAAGFEVQLRTDVDRRAMALALREFGERLRSSRVGLFYYAGHGMQIKGHNYLIPVGADIRREDEVAYESVDAQSVLDKMEAAGNGANLLILDACRNNPFLRRSRAATMGLAPMDAPVGTLVAFATAPGSVASDGAGSNGLYTQYLLRAMAVPGLKVEEVFKQVRAGVRRESQGLQVPWESTSLEGDLYFIEPAKVAAMPASAPVRPASAPAAAAAASAPRLRNAQGYTVGDTWNYQTLDKWKGEVTRNYTVRIKSIEADGSWISTSGLRHDEHGRLQSDPANDGSAVRWEPSLPRWWPGLKVGEARPFVFTQTRVYSKTDTRVWRIATQAKVEELENVKVPAGSFRAYRIVYDGSIERVGRGGSGRWRMTVWYAPEVRSAVAIELDSTWNGSADQRFRDELTSFELRDAAKTAPR